MIALRLRFAYPIPRRVLDDGSSGSKGSPSRQGRWGEHRRTLAPYLLGVA